MPHQQKKRRLEDDGQNNHDHLVTFDALSADVLARIFEYLSPENIMLARLNKKMKDAATKTVVPMDNDIDSAFHVNKATKYHTLAAMTTALPNLQQIKVGSLDVDRDNIATHKYNDGEDPNVTTAFCTTNLATCDIGVLSNFPRLRELKIDGAPLNGRYPMLFNFPLLQKLHIAYHYQTHTRCFQWDLGMLVRLPSLKELIVEGGIVTGSIRSLRVLIDTLSKIDIRYCRRVRGNVMDLADFPKLKHLCFKCINLSGDFEEMSKDAFPALEALKIVYCQNVRGNFMNLSDLPHLKVLDLGGNAVTGDIRDIGNDVFPSLESLELPCIVYGGRGFQLQSISDAPDIIAAVYTLMKKRPNILPRNWSAELSDNSPEWYEPVDEDYDELPFPPFTIEFVKAGPRLGWSWIDKRNPWTDCLHHPCEINWIDPEPSEESDDYENYIHELAEIEKNLDAYKGFYQPPTEEEYRRIYRSYYQRISNM